MESQQPIGLSEGQPTSVELLHLFDKMKTIRAFVFDVDGVFTDNNLLVTESGELLRVMNVRDGQALKWAVRAGYHTSVITGGRSEGVKKRLLGLGVHEYYDGIEDKWSAFQSIQKTTGLRASEVAYLGDDLPDLPVMRRVALSCCPADATPDVLVAADYVSAVHGGHGFVREVLEKIMRIQGRWPEF
ncbi:MAG: KdsC family phosphatase [Saprospiraceae bacterium]